MVEWNLFMGSIPPTSAEDWQLLFDKYKEYPEYQLVNFNIDLEEFKSIFYWEYGHRMFGRLIGLVFILPFLWFAFKRRISKELYPKLILILFMGAFQGFLGWYMVKSGLIKDPDVSHYRLAMHLVTAFLTFAYTFWVALGLWFPKAEKSIVNVKNALKILLPILMVQITWGAYVAGLNAGKIYNHWPKMSDEWIPEAVYNMKPIWINFISGLAGVQFVHRYLAYLVLGIVFYIAFVVLKSEITKLQKKSIIYLTLAVFFQFVLGVFALLYQVPVSLGLAHQLGAYLLLGSSVFAMHQFRGNVST